jgi:uncharacterized membrane protein YeaQ/YmgE (transglycosylase-associated protein family)
MMFIIALVTGLLAISIGASITKDELRAVFINTGALVIIGATLGQFVYILYLLGRLLERVT